jgi:hypothetical protein
VLTSSCTHCGRISEALGAEIENLEYQRGHRALFVHLLRFGGATTTALGVVRLHHKSALASDPALIGTTLARESNRPVVRCNAE